MPIRNTSKPSGQIRIRVKLWKEFIQANRLRRALEKILSLDKLAL